jgi:hypothetical protein
MNDLRSEGGCCGTYVDGPESIVKGRGLVRGPGSPDGATGVMVKGVWDADRERSEVERGTLAAYACYSRAL